MTHDDPLAARVERLESRLAIAARLRAYGDAIDGRDLGAFIDCFTDDGQWYVVAPSADDRGEETRRRTGRESLARGGRAVIDSLSGPTRHLQLGSDIDFESADRATVRSRFLTVVADSWQGTPNVVSVGLYIDTLVREGDGQWRIAVRRCEVEMSAAPPSA